MELPQPSAGPAPSDSSSNTAFQVGASCRGELAQQTQLAELLDKQHQL